MLAGQLNQAKVELQMAGKPLKGKKEDPVFVFIPKYEKDYNLRKYQPQVQSQMCLQRCEGHLTVEGSHNQKVLVESDSQRSIDGRRLVVERAQYGVEQSHT